MSAAELIKQVKTLPTRERKKFFAAVYQLEESAVRTAVIKAKRLQWPDVEARAKRIFGDRLLPNLVLLERDEQTF